MSPFFPAIDPYKTHYLPVDKLHTLYIEESGKKDGLPVVFMHGGPGAGSNENFRRIFDPTIYRIILFDQRGAGLSTPLGELINNTTDFLLSDIELIREHLGIDKWIVFGESWGSALGLVYAEKYPMRVLGMILRGVLLAQEEDINWFYQPGGVSRIYPEAWETFVNHIPKEQRNNILSSYYERLTSDNETTRLDAAKAFTIYGKSCNTLIPTQVVLEDSKNSLDALLISSQIEAHYYKNNFFLAPYTIMKNITKLEKIPAIIIHGRYDMCCTFANAYSLHMAWPSSQLKIVPDAGHSARESGYHGILVEATNSMAKLLL